MIRAALLLGVIAAPLAAQSPGPGVIIDRAPAPLAPIAIQLDGIPTSSLVTMLMRDVMRVPYVIAPDVLSDRRPTSVRLIIPRNKVPESVVGYLRRSGFTVQLEGGTVYVGRANGRGFAAGGTAVQNGSTPWGSPLSPAQNPITPQWQGPSHVDVKTELPAADQAERYSHSDGEPVIVDGPQRLLAYSPAHRAPDFLAAVIAPLFPKVTLGARSEPKANQESASIAPSDAPDLLVLGGSRSDLARVRRLIVALDRPRPLVAVKAVVMQVQDIHSRGSALSILASFAGGKAQVGSYPNDPPASQFMRLSLGAVKAVLSAVREDSRFKVVASPNLSALSGATATMNSGSQVPTIGAVSIAEGGTPVQSVIYRDSGITLTIRPVVRGDMVELSVREERSTFVPTTTGVEDSPTLQKSSVDAQVVLKSGESVVLAGLTEESAGNRREGLFGGLLGVRGRDKSKSELLVVLQAEIVPTSDVPPGVFIDLEAEGTPEDGNPTDPLAASPRRAPVADPATDRGSDLVRSTA
jgi:hypothetical protein